jgi:hypothetical protein
MFLTRVIAFKRGGKLHVKGDFRSRSGKRVRLSLGQADPNTQLRDILAKVEAAAEDFGELRKIGGV